MPTKNEMIDQLGKLDAEAAALRQQIEALPPDDDRGLKDDDWVRVAGRRFTGFAVVEGAVPDVDGEIRVRPGGGNSPWVYVKPSECTRIPDVEKLVESMMALPAPEGYEWTGEMRSANQRGDDVREGYQYATQPPPDNNLWMPIYGGTRKKA